MNKKFVLLAVVVLGGLVLMGAQSMSLYSGRYVLCAQEVTREHFNFNAELPKSTETVQRVFKIDTETGTISVYKEEYHRDANNKLIIKQYFEMLPVEKSVLNSTRD